MKKTLMTIAVLVTASLLCYGQEDPKSRTYRRDGNTFVQSPRKTTDGDIPTAYLWRDSKGNEYPIILHTYTKGEKKGRVTAYVLRTSKKTGKEYKYYLPNGEEIAREIMSENR